MKRVTQILLFGLFAQTGSAQICGWELLSQTGTPVGSRASGGLVYDPGSASVILFGGGTFAPLSTGTWRWDGAAWSHITTANAPATRSSHAMAADTSGTTNILVYGGGDGSTGVFTDTWTFDGNNWTNHPNVSGPTAKKNAAMVYHDAIGRFVHFSGSCFAGCFGETYEWDGSQWHAIFTAVTPAARQFHAMAYDPIRQEVVLYGGQLLPQGLGVANDTWVYDGFTWTQKIAPGPPPLVSHTMAFDPTRGTVVMHGGLNNGSTTSIETWEWNGSQWSLVGEIGTFGHYYHRMVYDGASAELISMDTSPTPVLRRMNWSTGPSITPVGGSATAEYPCPLTLGISATGSGTLSYQWYKDNAPLTNGGAISGANTDTLTINPTSAATAGAYRCEVTDNCSTDNSGTILVNTRCLADVNGNGVADPGDYTAWINAFNNNLHAAEQNCDGVITPADFSAWIANFNAGC